MSQPFMRLRISMSNNTATDFLNHGDDISMGVYSKNGDNSIF